MALSVGSVSVDVVPSARGFREKLAAQIRDVDAKVNVAPDLTGFREKVRAETLGMSTDVRVDVDKAGTAARSLSGLTAGMGGLAAAAGGLGSALVPVAAGLTAVLGGLSVPLVAATAGVGAFAIFAIPAFKAVTDASTKMAAAQLAVNSAVTSKQKETALAKQAQLMASLSPATLAAAKSLDTFKSTFKGFQTALAPQLFGVFNAGLSAATALLPSLASLAKAVAPALTGLATSLGKAFAGPAFKSFITFLSGQAASAVTAFGGILGNLAKGFGGLLVAFAPVGKTLLGGLAGLAKGFAGLSESKGFKAFLAYAVANLPTVGLLFGNLIRLVATAASALAPLGAVALKVVTAIVGLASHSKLAAAALALLALAFLPFVSGPVALVVAGIVAVGYAFKYVYDRSAPLRSVLAAVGGILRELATKAFPVLQKIARQAMDGIRQGIESVSKAIAKNRPQIDQLLRGFKSFETFVITKILPVLGPILKNAFLGMGRSISIAINVVSFLVKAFNGARIVVSAVLATFRTVWSAISAVVSKAVATVLAAVGRVKAVAGIIGAAFSAAYAAASGAIGRLVAAAAGIPGRVASAISGLGGRLFSAGAALIQHIIDGITSKIGAVTGAIGKVASAIASHLPGSPVKTGPLTVLNRGKAGGLISKMIADGILSEAHAVPAALSKILGGGKASGLSVPTSAAGMASGGGGIHVTVNGALDPKAVGQQIEQVLIHYQRVGKGGHPLGFKTA